MTSRFQTIPLEQRFWSKVRKDRDGCWEWEGARVMPGWHGKIRIHHQNVMVHRLSWEMHHGSIRAGLYVLHTCDNPPCVNPAHLYLGTKRDNILDAVRRGRHQHSSKTHCPRGHAYDDTNTYRDPRVNHRECRACRRLMREQRRAGRAA